MDVQVTQVRIINMFHIRGFAAGCVIATDHEDGSVTYEGRNTRYASDGTEIKRDTFSLPPEAAQALAEYFERDLSEADELYGPDGEDWCSIHEAFDCGCNGETLIACGNCGARKESFDDICSVCDCDDNGFPAEYWEDDHSYFFGDGDLYGADPDTGEYC